MRPLVGGWPADWLVVGRLSGWMDGWQGDWVGQHTANLSELYSLLP